MISYSSENVKIPNINRRAVSTWIKNVAARYNKKVGQVGYLFCDDDKILEINKQYLNHNYYTDIITFDYSERDVVSGDIFISLETVMSNSKLFNADFNTELYRVIIHGILHLCGQDDKTEAEAIQMRTKENHALKWLSAYICCTFLI
jgi:rRNA maturation RNase YbeY